MVAGRRVSVCGSAGSRARVGGRWRRAPRRQAIYRAHFITVGRRFPRRTRPIGCRISRSRPRRIGSLGSLLKSRSRVSPCFGLVSVERCGLLLRRNSVTVVRGEGCCGWLPGLRRPPPRAQPRATPGAPRNAIEPPLAADHRIGGNCGGALMLSGSLLLGQFAPSCRRLSWAVAFSHGEAALRATGAASVIFVGCRGAARVRVLLPPSFRPSALSYSPPRRLAR